jgi:hypothetical protein
MVGDEQDPFPQYMNRDTFLEALNMDIAFRGASRVMNRELHAQQLKDFLQTGAASQVAPGIPALTGMEIRNGLRRIYDTLGHKGSKDIVTPEGDQLVMQGAQAAQLQVQNAILMQQMQGMQTQQQMQMMQQPPEQPQAPGPEATIAYKDTPPDVKRQLEERAGLQPSQMGDLEVQQQIQKAQPKPFPAKQEGPPRG